MEAIKATFSRLSSKPSTEYQSVDNTSQEYMKDDERQGFLGGKEEPLPTDDRNGVSSKKAQRSLSLCSVIAIVIAAVVLTATSTTLLSRSSTGKSMGPWNYQDVSEHATEVIADLIKTSEPPKFRNYSPCGNTAEEAKARGCHFDTISFCWLPDECYDADLVETFEATRNWQFYLDEEGKHPISHEELIGGHGNNLWVSWEYHLRHCLFMWIKLHRAVLAKNDPSQPQIDSYIASLNHTNHCATILLTDRDVAFPTLNTETLVKYPHCGMIWT
ncbi:hypothetical protein F5Y18DRAFT_436771 [Xylariaceae sp. FL1019]|nr:hypothetical protein F5Y18DRAFT_436771 [Xylariaceae sp. FL1019]